MKSVRKPSFKGKARFTSPRPASVKLKYLAGPEAAMSASIGDVAPEQAAAAIRTAIETVGDPQ